MKSWNLIFWPIKQIWRGNYDQQLFNVFFLYFMQLNNNKEKAQSWFKHLFHTPLPPRWQYLQSSMKNSENPSLALSTVEVCVIFSHIYQKVTSLPPTKNPTHWMQSVLTSAKSWSHTINHHVNTSCNLSNMWL